MKKHISSLAVIASISFDLNKRIAELQKAQTKK